MPKWLFSQTNMQGSSQIAAMLKAYSTIQKNCFYKSRTEIALGFVRESTQVQYLSGLLTGLNHVNARPTKPTWLL